VTRIKCKLDAPDGLVVQQHELEDSWLVSLWAKMPNNEEVQAFARKLSPECELVLEIPDAE